VTEGLKLDSHHRHTLGKVFEHPLTHNLQWHDLLSLLEAVAEVSEGKDGRYKVRLGVETETFDVPRGKDVTEQQIIDIRRMLRNAGITPEGLEAH